MSRDRQILAKTIYGEARGEYGRLDGGLAALIAVGNVVANRLKQQSWFGATISEVCQKPWQFSCWNSRDPNYALLTQEIMNPLYETCLMVAEHIIKGDWPDLTKGADHYHTVSMTHYPRWSQGHKPVVRIGSHLFYKIGGCK